MIGTELLTRLQQLTPEELLLPVRVCADHGEFAMVASGVGVELLVKEEYMASLVHPDDADGTQPQCILIEAA